MMMMIVVILGLVCSCMMSVAAAGAAVVLNPDLMNKFKAFFNPTDATTTTGGDTTSDGKTFTSDEILTAKRGPSKFSGSCPSGRFVKRVYMAHRDSGRGIAQHGRVDKLALMCSDGKDKILKGPKSEMTTNLECKDGMKTIDTWKTSDAIQQINAYCQTGSNANILAMGGKKANTGSAIGDQVSINCPDGMKVSGVSGTYDDGAIRSWTWMCSKI